MHVVPTPCLLASQKTPLREAIALMNQRNTNYIILLDEQQEIIGVFTERDLLKRVLEFDKEGLWDRPISLVMNRAVKTLPLRLLNTAPEFMIAHRIRHVPIVMPNEDTKKNDIVGVVTDHNLFESWAKSDGLRSIFSKATKANERKVLGIASPDGTLWKLFSEVYGETSKVDTSRYQYTNLQTEGQLAGLATHCDAVILDVDNAPQRFWLPAIGFFMKNKKLEFVAVVADEDKHDNLEKNLFQIGESQGTLHIYSKPLDITQLTFDLENYWAGRGQK